MKTAMMPKPVDHSSPPAYPTRREMLAGTAAIVLLHLSGCGQNKTESTAEPASAAVTNGVIVAPIFEHGEGRGSTGCDTVVPAVFLSEEEGMQILREELAKHGVQLKQGGMLDGVLVSARTMKVESVKKFFGGTEHKSTVVEDPGRSKPLQLDGLDADRQIAVAFVSEKDYFDLGGIPGGVIQDYDFKDIAGYVAAQVRKQGKDALFFGVFYDPFAMASGSESSQGKKRDPKDAFEAALKLASDESKKLLRQQAQDFVAWLKEQKAIQ